MGLCTPHFQRAIRFPHAAPSVTYPPATLAKAYGFPTVSPAGQPDPLIGIIELGGGFSMSDITLAFQGYGLPAPSVVAVGVDGGSNSPGNDADVEVLLDIQVAAAAYSYCTGRPAKVRVYFAPNTDQGFADAVKAAAADGCATISISWGAPEDQWGAAACKAFDAVCAAAVAAGSVIFAASGDNDSTDGETGDHVDFPASSPHVVGCGGTRRDANGVETVWSDGRNGTGGGFSTVFPVQAFQVGVPTGPGRMVPDVAAVADPQTGYQITANGQQIIVGGTSAVSPLYAGLFAAIAVGSGGKLGNVLPALYTHPAAFADVTSGNNGTWRAKAGIDPCTGLGVPIGTALLSVFSGTTPPPPPPPPASGFPAESDSVGLRWNNKQLSGVVNWNAGSADGVLVYTAKRTAKTAAAQHAAPVPRKVNLVAALMDATAVFLAIRSGNIVAAIAAGERLLADLGVPDPTPED